MQAQITGYYFWWLRIGKCQVLIGLPVSGNFHSNLLAKRLWQWILIYRYALHKGMQVKYTLTWLKALV